MLSLTLIVVLSALLAASPGLSSSAGFTVVWPGSNFKNVVEVLAPHVLPRAALRTRRAVPFCRVWG
jgi:hypothetical protein